jgi:hypothetical protein
MARKSKREEDIGSRAAQFAMASGDMRRTQSYVDRGRQFKDATTEDLQTLFVQMFRIWGADPWWEGRSRLEDVEAEYKLRGVEPPFALVKDDLEKAISAIADGIEQMNAEERAEIGSGIVEDYLIAQKSRN